MNHCLNFTDLRQNILNNYFLVFAFVPTDNKCNLELTVEIFIIDKKLNKIILKRLS